MLSSRATLLNARMVGLDRKSKRIGLDSGASISYDILIVSVGLIDQTMKELNLVSAGIGPDRDEEVINGVYSIDDPFLYDHFKKGDTPGTNIQMLTRVKKPKKICIYGRTLHTFAFINGLINRGVPPNRIILAIPPRVHQLKDTFKNNDEKLQYQDDRLNDPEPFDDPIIEKKIFTILEELNVEILRDHIIESENGHSDLIQDEDGNLC